MASSAAEGSARPYQYIRAEILVFTQTMLTPPTTAIEQLYRSEWGRILATVIRLVGDFDLAEEATQEAFAAAVEQWRDGVPEHPRSWIITTARNKAIDRIRRRTRFEEIVGADPFETRFEPHFDRDEIPDDRLRLIFTCCHPAISPDAQVALTLRTLAGLETAEIARAFLVPEATMAQRLVRAKRKIRDAGIPYKVPDTHDIPQRLDVVLTVMYLIFNEGYAATRGSQLVRTDLCNEAIRLARLVVDLMRPQPPSEATGLLALMLLHDSRRHARFDANGDLVVLEDQDRLKWNRTEIAEALPLVEESLRRGAGAFALQAAIAALHCEAARAADTDWNQIVRLYDRLFAINPSPVVALNRAVALAMTDGPRRGLELIDSLRGELDDYHLLHSARADLFRRLGNNAEASASYRRALALVINETERRYLTRRLREVENSQCA